MTRQAQAVISETNMKARAQAAKAEADAEHYKGIASEALDALDAAAEEHEQHKLFAAAAIGGAAVLTGILGGVAGMAIARRQQAAAIAHISQEMVEVRRRSAAEVARAERYGCAKLAKSLVPALDAMDALVADVGPKTDAGGSQSSEHQMWAEGAAMTRSVLHDALRAHGVTRIDPPIGTPFDVAVMEAMLTIPVTEATSPPAPGGPGGTSGGDGDGGGNASAATEGAPASLVGTVQSVLRPGYVLHDGERVLRPVQVGVGAAA